MIDGAIFLIPSDEASFHLNAEQNIVNIFMQTQMQSLIFIVERRGTLPSLNDC